MSESSRASQGSWATSSANGARAPRRPSRSASNEQHQSVGAHDFVQAAHPWFLSRVQCFLSRVHDHADEARGGPHPGVFLYHRLKKIASHSLPKEDSPGRINLIADELLHERSRPHHLEDYVIHWRPHKWTVPPQKAPHPARLDVVDHAHRARRIGPHIQNARTACLKD